MIRPVRLPLPRGPRVKVARTSPTTPTRTPTTRDKALEELVKDLMQDLTPPAPTLPQPRLNLPPEPHRQLSETSPARAPPRSPQASVTYEPVAEKTNAEFTAAAAAASHPPPEPTLSPRRSRPYLHRRARTPTTPSHQFRQVPRSCTGRPTSRSRRTPMKESTDSG